MKTKLYTILVVTICIFMIFSSSAFADSDSVTVNFSLKVEETYSVSPGTIRYVQQTQRYSYFYSSYWGDNSYASGYQCNLAAYSMALSYVNVDMLPKDMTIGWIPPSGLKDTAASESPVSSVSEGIDRMNAGNGKYSPVLVHMNSYSQNNGGEHWVVIAGRTVDGDYYIVDPAYGIGVSTYYYGQISGNTLIVDGHSSTISEFWQFYNPGSVIDPERPVINGDVEAAFVCFEDGTEGCYLTYDASDNIGVTNFYVNVWEYGQTENQARRLNGDINGEEITVLLDPRDFGSKGPFYARAYAFDAAGNPASVELASPISFYRCVADSKYIATYRVVSDGLDYYASPSVAINGRSTKIGTIPRGTKITTIGVDTDSYNDEYYQDIGPNMLQLEDGNWVVYSPDFLERCSWWTLFHDQIQYLKYSVIVYLADYGMCDISQAGSFTVHALTVSPLSPRQ